MRSSPVDRPALRGLLACLALVVISSAARAATVQLADLPANARLIGDVAPLPDDPAGLLFAGGHLELPTAGLLTPAAGSIDLQCRVPEIWPAGQDTALLHIGEESHVHLTLFFRNGGLIAVYKGGEEYYSSLSFREARAWQPGSWHHVEFTWSTAEPPDVAFFLRVDDQLIGGGHGHLIDRWPARLRLGGRPGAMPWPGAMRQVKLSPEPAIVPELAPGERTIRVDAGQELGEAWPFWTIGNYTSQHMFADPQQFERIRADRPNMRSVNCVRLLGGRDDGRNEWFLGYGADGRGQYDFAGLLTYLPGARQRAAGDDRHQGTAHLRRDRSAAEPVRLARLHHRHGDRPDRSLR
jgi:hypothetical protein